MTRDMKFTVIISLCMTSSEFLIPDPSPSRWPLCVRDWGQHVHLRRLRRVPTPVLFRRLQPKLKDHEVADHGGEGGEPKVQRLPHFNRYEKQAKVSTNNSQNRVPQLEL